jgi:hypothetical protein
MYEMKIITILISNQMKNAFKWRGERSEELSRLNTHFNLIGSFEVRNNIINLVCSIANKN